MLVCRFVRFSRFSLKSHELLDKTYILYAHRIPDKMPQIRHGQNATGQNATKRKPDKMQQNKNASKL